MTELNGIKNITISGRIGSGQTTLATHLANKLGWDLLEGGALFEKIHKELNVSEVNVDGRPDNFDLEYEEKIKKMLRDENHHIIQSHLAGFDAQGIEGVFKILIVCEDEQGNDKLDIRIDRLVNSRNLSIDQAKEEAVTREKKNLDKWRRLYADSDPNWVNWDSKYYDLVINTYSHNPEQSLEIAMKAIGIQK